MLKQLNTVLSALPKLLNKPEVWSSLIINRRKPETYRIFTYVGSYRISLHRFKPCDTEDSFFHPHPWPGAFHVLRGRYDMRMGLSSSRQTKPQSVARFIMGAGSSYEMVEPLAWHAITPLEETYSVMINTKPYSPNLMHVAAPTTKGKDLEKMTEEELESQLYYFSSLLFERGFPK